VAYNENGPSEIITHEKDGLLVDPKIENGLALMMQRILHDADLRQTLGNAGRETVVEKFHIADSAQKIADLYSKIRD
jgi:glycosyltransferase involved in cell wall biosynthesis